MRCKLIMLLALLITLVPLSAQATDPPIADIPPGEDVIEPVKKGAPSPFSGQVFSPETALRWANWLQQYRLRLEQDKMYYVRLQTVDQEYWTKRMALVQVAHTDTLKLYQARIDEQQKSIVSLTKQVQDPPFYKTTWFGFVGGVLVTGIAIGAGAAIVAGATN